MAQGSPFVLVPWQTDFPRALLDLALEESNGDVSRAVFLFPHSRPRRYLALLIHRTPGLPRPLLMPQTHTISSLFAAVSGRILARPAWNAGLLDRVGLLLNCARAEAEDEDTPFLSDARRFFPWGIRLASLFEECFSQHRTPGNFLHMDAQVSPFAALLLERLGGIFARYGAALREREWTTPGLDAFLTADWLRERDCLPEGILPDDGPLYIAGFHAPSGAEQILFHHLWQRRGARVVVHADPALIEDRAQTPARNQAQDTAHNPAQPHWSCRGFADWAVQWRTRLELRGDAAADAPPPDRIRYYAGFDLHSQLAEFAGLLEQSGKEPEEAQNDTPPEDMPLSATAQPDQDSLADTVIALPDSGLLMPVLHHLPLVDVNISMGYPLARSPLFRLLDTLLKLQEGRKRQGYYWRHLVDLIRHPYVKMLAPVITDEPGQDSGGPGRDTAQPSRSPDGSSQDTKARALPEEPPAIRLRRELHRLEQALRAHGRAFADPFTLLEEVYQVLPPEEFPPAPVLALLEELLRTLLTGFENPGTPRDLAAALERLCAFLLAHGRPLWRRFPLDAECLYRLRQSLIPELAKSVPANEPFPPETLFAILRGLLEEERVPFEAAPLVGLQVMGMLETRLLSFRRVIIVDAGEDGLPGSFAGDPLLPEALRPEIGLPSLQTREQVAAYNFFRLLAGAREIALFWQEGGDVPGIQERNHKKSRFVEELLWEEEKRRGRLLASRGQDGPLTVLAAAVRPVPRERPGIPVTPPVRALLRELLQRPVSASLLDSYLRCPARFFHERLVRLAPAKEVIEGDDPLAVGDLLHQVLHEVYDSRLDSPLPGGEALADMLGPELLDTLFASPAFRGLHDRLPADSRAMLTAAAQKRLGDYLRNQPPTTVLALETPLRACFSRAGQRWSLTGKADRIDLRYEPELSGEAPEAEAADFRPDNRPGNRTDGRPGNRTDSRANGRTDRPSDNRADGLTDCPAGGEAGLIILDYKTGRVPVPDPTLWEDEALWEALRAWQPDHTPPSGTPPLLARLAARLESVQLPFYLLLYSLAAMQGTMAAGRPDSRPDSRLYGQKEAQTKNAGQASLPSCFPSPLLSVPPALPLLDARWVALGGRGEEAALFPLRFSGALRREIIQRHIPDLVHFLLRHMLESPVLLPCPGRHCDWCSSAKLCIL